MKPPSTVEAKVAEELRNWLSSELEQLDASNTNQFAHHVVTILLHEDLDIEDEPLSNGDDFLKDIYSIRKGKTRDKQKKAAVQFLRSAVCCNDPGEAEIQGVVDELMVKIEETKIRMNSKSSPKRISVTVQNPFNQPSVKSNPDDRERLYNEAFPSLHSNNNSSSLVWHKLGSGGTENLKDAVRSKQQIESSHYALLFNSQEEAHACNTARRVFFSAIPETVLPSLETTEILPSEQMDSLVSDCAYSWWSVQSAFQACTLLKKFVPSASPLKPVSMSTPPSNIWKEFSPTVIPVINQSDLQTLHLDPSYEKTLTDHPQLFRPIKERPVVHETPPSEVDIEVDNIFNCKQLQKKKTKKVVDKPKSSVLITTYDGGGDGRGGGGDGTGGGGDGRGGGSQLDDESVGYQFSRDETLHDDGDDDDDAIVDLQNSGDEIGDHGEGSLGDENSFLRATPHCCHTNCLDLDDSKKCPSGNLQGISDGICQKWTSEIDEVCSFQQHHGRFWKLLADNDSMALYPVLTNQLLFEVKDTVDSCHQRCVTPGAVLETSLLARNVRSVTGRMDIGDLSDYHNVKTKVDCYFCQSSPDASFGHGALESACIQVQYYYAVRQIAHVQQEHKLCMQQTSLQNLFLPSVLSSCLSHEGSQSLQRAFVNSYFSSLFKEPVCSSQDKVTGFRCSDLENGWFMADLFETGGRGQAQAAVVPGCTCSSWLENNCHLGDSCPFSHPSI